MDKPTSHSVLLDYQKCEKWISYELGYELCDVLNSNRHYYDWCKLVGQKCDNTSQEQYLLYIKHPEGKYKCPEYCNYWHFLKENLIINNPCKIIIDSGLLNSSKNWQNIITQKFIDEFGDNTEYRVKW